jgi:ElaB/YqjD/DUF883 family membrane-anchored ribosome-binding protein
MAKRTTEFENVTADDRSTVGQTVSDTAAQVKDTASELGRRAADTIDESRTSAASGMEKAAAALHDNADRLPGGERVGNLARVTADKLGSTADYVRTHDVNRMMADVETLVRNNPGASLAVAAFVGFLAGRAFSRSDY